jgi:choline-glycine betaine transporter
MSPRNPRKRVGPAPKELVGDMTVVITIGDVSITIKGPVAQVTAVLDWLFGTTDSAAMIANLQLVFGPETAISVK